MARHRYLLVEMGTTALIIGAIWIYSEGAHGYAVVPLNEVFSRFREVWLFERFFSDVVPSLWRLALGFGTATIVGITMGILLGEVPMLRLLSQPVVSFLRAMPAVALIPPAIVLLGVGVGMKVFIIAFMCCWPILLNTADGVVELPSTLRDSARAYRIRGMTRIFRVVLPAVGPRIFAGMRTSLSWAILLLVASEMLASTNGIGYFVIQSQQSFNLSGMWAGVVLLGLLGYLLNLALVGSERRVLRWHASTQQRE